MVVKLLCGHVLVRFRSLGISDTCFFQVETGNPRDILGYLLLALPLYTLANLRPQSHDTYFQLLTNQLIIASPIVGIGRRRSQLSIDEVPDWSILPSMDGIDRYM